MISRSAYDAIGENYSNADMFGSITRSHNVAIEQIKKIIVDRGRALNILDLGVGDALFVKRLENDCPNANYTGIDISSKMLKIARKSCPFLKTIHCSAIEAYKHLPANSQDIVIAHFINAYIGADELFEQARLMMNNQSILSFITSTYDSFPILHKQVSNVKTKNQFINKLVNKFYNASNEITKTPRNKEDLLKTLDAHQFEIIFHKRIEVPLYFKDDEQLYGFSIDGGWFLNVLFVFKFLPRALFKFLYKNYANQIFDYPIQDKHIIDIVLAKKRVPLRTVESVL